MNHRGSMPLNHHSNISVATCPQYGYSMVMTMHINLSPEMEGYIKGKVNGGFYGNATEVIRDAIRRMQAEEDRVTALLKALAEGEAQLDRGEGTEYSRELMKKLADTARKNLGSGKPIDPDVIP